MVISTNAADSGTALATRTMSCMEIWGGNQPFDSGISTRGMDAWVHCRPYGGDARGGDVYYVSTCGRGRIARFAIMDVSGHGESVGELASALRRLMRKHIGKLNQTRFIRALAKEFAARAQTGIFATALLASFYAPTDHLVICNAGHPRPLWYQARTDAWSVLRHDIPHRVTDLRNLPLGIVPDTEYYQFAVRLEEEDLVLIYSDSLVEARNAQGALLGEQGLLGIVRGIDVSQPGTFNKTLLRALSDYRNGAPSDDDVTIILLHHNAAHGPQQSLRQMVTTLGKMVGLLKV